MIPGIIMELKSFPLTSSGKLNRRALPEPVQADVAAENYAAPRNEMEAQLESIWKAVLGLERVSIHDNFFRIGGDSIISIRLISRINKHFNVTLTIGQLYESNTIAGLSDQITNNTISTEENQKIRDEIRMAMDSWKNEVMNNLNLLNNEL
jgi:acyl carrier protein